MRHPDDKNNVDRIGDPESPGLRKGELTRPEKRDHLAGLGIRGDQAEETLDAIYAPAAAAATLPLLEPTKS